MNPNFFKNTLLNPLKINIYACITFFYVQKRLPYLARALRSLCLWLCSNIEIIIVVNCEISEQSMTFLKLLINTYLSDRVTIKIHVSNPLEDNFDLTWIHKELMYSAYHSTNPQYDLFLYLEDDIEISWINLLYWLEFLPILKTNQLIPGFIRIEQRIQDGMWMSTDCTRKTIVNQLKSIEIGEYQFINVENPYQAFWILDRDLMAEHLISPSFHKDDSLKTRRMGIRERATMGLLYENIPQGFKSRHVVPIQKDRKYIEWFATVHHLANNYANNPNQKLLGKFPFGQILSQEELLDAQEYFKAGNNLKQGGKLNEAITAYRKAIEINSENAEYHFSLGEVLAEINQLEEAIASYALAQKNNSKWFKPYYNKALILEKKGELDSAINNCKKAIELNPNFSWSYSSLANILAQKGLLSEAVKYHKDAIKVHNNQQTLPMFYIKLGELLVKQEKLDEAISAYHTTIKLGYTGFKNYYQIGILYKQQQKFSEAINYFVKALQYSPGDVITYYEIGDILEKQGLFSEADFCYRQRNLPINIINKYYQPINNYSVTNSSNLPLTNKLVYQSIYPASEISLVLPKAFDDNIHYSVKKTEASAPETLVVSLQDGRGWSDGASSAIITSDNQVLADISTGGFHIIAASKIADPTYNIDGVVAFLSGQFSTIPNYCHWMFDILPRIELLRLSGIDINSIDKFVLHRCNEKKFQKETLSCLGIDSTKIIDTYQHNYIRASKLLIPSILAHPCNVGGKWAVEFLRKSFLQQSSSIQNTQPKKRFYISRKSASKRKIINEEVILEVLNKYGFTTVVMDSLSVLEQALLLANAEAVISAHGANLTNIVFCNPGTKIIEIFSPMYGTDTYFTISNLCSLEYYNLIGKDFDNSQATITTKRVPNSNWGGKDIYVDKNDLLNLLKFAGLT